MGRPKNIFDYFNAIVEYPMNYFPEVLLPWNVLWEYVPSSLLNGFINNTDEPLLFLVIDRYTSPDWIVLQRNGIDMKKIEVIVAVQNNEIEISELNYFNDDVIILSTLPNDYIFFYFDMDISDCMIGRFKTEDSVEDVINTVIHWLDTEKEKHKGMQIKRGLESGIINYYKLPVSIIQKGWVRF